MDIIYLPMPPKYPFEGSECFHHVISDSSESGSDSVSEDAPHFFRSMAEAFRHVQQQQDEHGVVMKKRNQVHQHKRDTGQHHGQNKDPNHDGRESQESSS